MQNLPYNINILGKTYIVHTYIRLFLTFRRLHKKVIETLIWEHIMSLIQNLVQSGRVHVLATYISLNLKKKINQ